jgi:hypothetical protein
MWSWLAKSWAAPGATPTHAVPPAAADSDPVLTVKALNQMTAFWGSFMKEPDSVKGAGSVAQQEDPTLSRVTMSIGQQGVSVIKVNMIALAAKYPSVAADLEKAGLTAQQEEAYRVALIRVKFTHMAGTTAGTIADSSVLGKNMAFWKEHDKEFSELDATEMWTTM